MLEFESQNKNISWFDRFPYYIGQCNHSQERRKAKFISTEIEKLYCCHFYIMNVAIIFLTTTFQHYLKLKLKMQNYNLENTPLSKASWNILWSAYLLVLKKFDITYNGGGGGFWYFCRCQHNLSSKHMRLIWLNIKKKLSQQEIQLPRE